uniref:Vitellogenin domain-containing protein n=1 Tax=Parastrongyloides trichosuri TaxID=131310 RepID=A0A0N5A6H3_PARTI
MKLYLFYIFLLLICIGFKVSLTEDGTKESNIEENPNDGEKPNEIEKPTEEEKPKELTLDFDNFDPKTLPKKTRLIFYKYLFKGETFVYEDRLGIKKGLNGGKIEAMFLFDVLHHDMEGHMLLRLKGEKCHFGDCNIENSPEIYLDVVQGYQNLIGYYVKMKNEDDQLHWNFLHGVAAALSNPSEHGEGDIQTVVIPQGTCRFEWYRPEDKKFIRRIGNCVIGGDRNSSIVDGFTTTYNQEVTYHQNKKYDGDIVVCKTTEKYNIKSQFHKDWNFKVESVSQIEMENRDKKYIDRICPAEYSVSECITTIFNATFVGGNWKEIKSKFVLAHNNKESFNFNDYVEAYRDEIIDKNDSDLFGQVVASGVTASFDDLKNAISNPDNDHIIDNIVDVIAAIGDEIAIKVAKEVLPLESKELVNRFAESIAYTSRVSDKIINEINLWIDETNDVELKDKLLKAFGVILRRKCELTLSTKNACNRGVDTIVNGYIKKIIELKNPYKSLTLLKPLSNMKSVIDYAKTFICDKTSSVEIEIEALEILTEITDEQWDQEITNKLVKVFRNTCPKEQNTLSQSLAIDILLEKAKDNQNIATYLLRGEEVLPSDNEGWNYFYSALKNSRQYDEENDEFWEKIRRFKVFREHYGKKSVNGKSSIETNKYSSWPGVKINLEDKEIFGNDGSLLYDNTKLTFRMNRRSKFVNIFELHSNGSMSFVDQEMDTEKLYNKNALLRFYQGTHVLMSGFNFKTFSALSLNSKVFHFDDILHSRFLLTLAGKVSLYGENKFHGLIDSKVSLKTPYEKISYAGCTNLSEEDKSLEQTIFIHTTKPRSKKTTIKRKQKWSGFCRKPKTFKMLETCRNALA